MIYKPMLAKDSKVRQTGSGWIVERKWDGMRAMVHLTEERTFIWSRTGQDLRERFPELLDLHERVGVPCVLDGEIVAMVDPDQENLELLQDHRKLGVTCTIKFFDVLEVTGTPALSLPLWQRRDLLMEILIGTEFDVPELLPYGQEIPEHWEGVISKVAESTYEPGKRRASWTKWKFTKRATLRICGLTAGKGARASSFGACEVEDGDGIKRGQVGSGFNDALIAEIERLWDFWIREGGDRPLIDVEYRFMSKTGLMVNTAYKGVRYDKMEADRF